MNTTQSAEIEVHQPSTILAISSGQSWFTERQLAALHHMGLAENTPKGDLAVFLHHCQRTGLDPFAKQIYMICRNVKENDRWVSKYTIQVGIDGYRVVGDRIADRRGDAIEHDEPLWADADGVWRDLWLSDEPPVAAKYTIVKNGKRNVATVMYREFMQTKKNGEPNSMWTRMPANQLAKCAEAAAWRKVYPNDFAGLVLEGTAQPTDDDVPVAPRPTPPARVTADEITGTTLREQAPDAQQYAEVWPPADHSDGAPEIQPPEDDRQADDGSYRRQLNRHFNALLTKGGLPKGDRAKRMQLISHLCGRALDTSDDILDKELAQRLHELQDLDRQGVLKDTFTAFFDSLKDEAPEPAPEAEGQEKLL